MSKQPSECVKVMVRVRPMNDKERRENSKSCVVVDRKTQQIQLQKDNNAEGAKMFSFDQVFDTNETQQNIYELSAFGIVESCFEGYNGTIFAYGQTGCGKTFTMMGDPSKELIRGIIPRTFSHIMDVINTQDNKKFLVRVSYIEIYNEEIHDLLGKDVKARYELKEHPDKGLFIKDLSMNIVKSVNEMERYMDTGNKNRTTGETLMNKDSSRSHSIFTVYIECSQEDEKGNQRITAGKLNLVDLAGSERQSKTQATGDRLKEANKINLSLSALGNVISALVDGKSQHIPYRDSKLTRLLQDSLGGNTKTIMIANCSPADYNYDETLGTLRYASRAKQIKNKPIVNEDPKDALLKEYASEIQRLKAMLENQGMSQSKIITGLPNLNESQGTKKLSTMIQHKNTQEFEQLKQNHKAMASEKDKMANELKQRELEVQKEKEEREKLESQLNQMLNQQIQGGKEKDEEKKKKISNMRKKLKEEQKKQEELIRIQQEKEEDFLKIEKNFQNLQEENQALKDQLKKMASRYKNADQEIADLQKEHYQQIEDLNDTLRIYEKEQKLFEAILRIMLTKHELGTIRQQAEWQDDKNQFKVPPFYFKNKEIKFPKLPYHQAMDLVEKEKTTRELDFNADNRRDSHKAKIRLQNSRSFERQGSQIHISTSVVQSNLPTLGNSKIKGGMQEFSNLVAKQQTQANNSGLNTSQGPKGPPDQGNQQKLIDKYYMYRESVLQLSGNLNKFSMSTLQASLLRQNSQEYIQNLYEKKNVNVTLDPLSRIPPLNSPQIKNNPSTTQNYMTPQNQKNTELPSLNHNPRLPNQQHKDSIGQQTPTAYLYHNNLSSAKKGSQKNLQPLKSLNKITNPSQQQQQQQTPSKIDLSIKATLHFDNNNNNPDQNLSQVNEEVDQ